MKSVLSTSCVVLIGVISGKTIFQKSWKRLQPSMEAACSSSRGTVLTKPVIAVRLMEI